MSSIKSLYRYYVNAESDRPEYWSVVAFLFPDRERIDTDGDSFPATSTTWTWLSIRKRDSGPQVVEIYPAIQTPLVLVVESKARELAARTAYYLAKSMDTGVSLMETGPATDFATIAGDMGDNFNIAEAMRRVAQFKSP